MRIKAESRTEAPPNLMPLIDMVFLLLIFFLVATTFRQEELDSSVALPGASREIKQPMSQPPQNIINILHDGTMMVSGKSKTRKQIVVILTRLASDPGRNLLIRADQRSRFSHFAWVAARARERGIAEARIGYVVEDPKPVISQIPTKGHASGT